MKAKLFQSIIVLALLPAQLYSQGIPGPIDNNAFMDLTQRRTQLNSSIPYINTQISALNIPDTFLLKKRLALSEFNFTYYSGKLRLQKPAPPGETDTSAAKNAVDFFEHEVNDINDSLSQARKDFQNKKILATRLDSAQRALSEVEFHINQIMIPKISQQNFLFYASLAFVLLMGILLFTFYKVVFKDEKVRFAVFGSDSGLQFVTLFSIIIAIILFGLTGILEGKELSALLGSIAGYILGKAKLGGEGTPANAGAGGPGHPADANNPVAPVVAVKPENGNGAAVKPAEQDKPAPEGVAEPMPDKGGDPAPGNAKEGVELQE